MITLVPLLLFLHLLAVAGLFAGIGIEAAAFAQLRRARTVDDARAALALEPSIGRIMGPSAGVLILAGLGMVYGAGFGWQPWTLTGLVVAVALSVNGPLTNGRRMERLHRLAHDGGDGPIGVELDAARRDRFLTFSVAAQVTLLAGMLYVMSNKPSLPVCLAAIAVAVVIAVVPALANARTVETATPAST